VNLTRQNKDGLKGSVTLPAGTTGRFVWKGKEINLKAGKQEVSF
jgi:hypothetical protein